MHTDLRPRRPWKTSDAPARLRAALLGLLLCCLAWLGSAPAARAQNAAAFVSQSVPAGMIAGQTYLVSVTYRNTGAQPWTAAAAYRLGTQDSQDNLTWAGTNRVSLPATVAPGASTTFTFFVTAPSAPGTFAFQCQIVQDGVQWFGDPSPPVAVAVAAAPGASDILVADPGFENPAVTGQGASQYGPVPASVWTFSDQAGLAGNGGTFTSLNPNAPEGSQVAFLQGDGSVSQTLYGFQANTRYSVILSAAQRANYQWSYQSVYVLLDGRLIGYVQPAPGGGYADYASASFTTTPGAHTLTLAGANPAGGDNTALIDDVRVAAVPALAAPAGLAASAGNGQVALSWAAAAGASGYLVYRSTASGVGYLPLTLDPVSGTSYTDASAANGETYYYVVTAVGPGGVSPPSGEAPATPAGFTAVLRVNAGGGAVGAFAADAGYGGGTAGTFADACDTSAPGAAPAGVYQTLRGGQGGFTYALGGLAPGGSYTLRLHFAEPWYGVAWRGGLSDGTGQRLMDVTVNGSAALTGLDVYAAAGGPDTALVESVPATADGSGVITVGFGCEAGSPDQTAFVNGLEVLSPCPSGLTASAGDGQVALSWTGVAGASGYAVKRAVASGGPYAAVSPPGGVSGTAYTDAGLTDGVTYYYVVTALTGAGEGNPSNEAGATPVAAAPSGPPAPSGLAVLPGDGQLALSWAAVPGATGYALSRSLTSGGPYAPVTPAGGVPGTAYTDTGLADGTPYFYVVSAVAGGTEGPRSDEAMGVPVAPPAAVGSPAPAAYGYGADGLRAWKSVGGQTTYFLYDGGLPLCELDGGGSVTATNTWGPDGLLSRNVPVLGGTPTQGSVFYAFDPQGAVSLRLDSSANVLDAFLFDAYGLRTGTDSTADPYSGFLGQWGGYDDAETGLTLLGERYYDAGQGRFLTRDPLGYAGGQNLYAYSYSDPINFMDPSGLCPDSGDGFAGWLDRSFLFGGATARLGELAGEYDAGRVSGWDVAQAGGDWLMHAGAVATGAAGIGKLAVAGVGALATGGAEQAGEEGVTLFRGLRFRHEGYEDALNGEAYPIGGHADPELHIQGHTNSIWTSWTNQLSTATHYANPVGAEGPGVILQKTFSPAEVAKMIATGNTQGEFLVEGPVLGATPWFP